MTRKKVKQPPAPAYTPVRARAAALVVLGPHWPQTQVWEVPAPKGPTGAGAQAASVMGDVRSAVLITLARTGIPLRVEAHSDAKGRVRMALRSAPPPDGEEQEGFVASDADVTALLRIYKDTFAQVVPSRGGPELDVSDLPPLPSLTVRALEPWSEDASPLDVGPLLAAWTDLATQKYALTWEDRIRKDVLAFRLLLAVARRPLAARGRVLKTLNDAGFTFRVARRPGPGDVPDAAWNAGADVWDSLSGIVEDGDTVPAELAQLVVDMRWGEMPPLADDWPPTKQAREELGKGVTDELGGSPPVDRGESADEFDRLAAEGVSPAEIRRVLLVLLAAAPARAPILLRGYRLHVEREEGRLADLGRDLAREAEVELKAHHEHAYGTTEEDREILGDLFERWTVGLRDQLADVTSRLPGDAAWAKVRRAFYLGGTDADGDAFGGMLPWINQIGAVAGREPFVLSFDAPEPTLLAVLAVSRHLPAPWRTHATSAIRKVLAEIRDHVGPEVP